MSGSTLDLTSTRVLVTGGLGFIGSSIANECVRLGAAVTIYDSLDPECGGNPANVEDIRAQVRIILNDVRSYDALAPVVRDATIVFHCAAQTSHARSMADPRKDIEVNCTGTINLLEAARRSSELARLVYVGTSSQIGAMTHDPVTEDHRELPKDVYSANKAAAEKYALIYGDTYGLPATSVRLANVYGPRARISDAGLGFMNYFVGLAFQGKDVTVYGDGTQTRTATFVDDAVRAVILAAVAEGARGAVLFATSEERYPVRAIADAIVRGIGRGRVRSVPWPGDRAAIEVGDMRISSERIRRVLGWEATTSLEEGLARTREWFEPRLAHYLT